MNYSGRRCAFVYTPADTDTDAVKKCFLSSEELGDLTLAEKNDAGAREIRCSFFVSQIELLIFIFSVNFPGCST